MSSRIVATANMPQLGLLIRAVVLCRISIGRMAALFNVKLFDFLDFDFTMLKGS